MIRKYMKRTLLFLFACGMAVCHAHAQDTTTVSRIDFKYNENGAIIKVAPYVEGTEESSMMAKKTQWLSCKTRFYCH